MLKIFLIRMFNSNSCENLKKYTPRNLSRKNVKVPTTKLFKPKLTLSQLILSIKKEKKRETRWDLSGFSIDTSQNLLLLFETSYLVCRQHELICVDI